MVLSARLMKAWGMEYNRPEQVTLGPGKLTCSTRSHTLPTPGVHLPEAEPALYWNNTKHFRPLASPRGTFFPFLAHFMERDIG